MDSLLMLAADPAAWAALAALIAMEVVLGIDNLIFIAILTNRLPEHQRENGRRIGCGGGDQRDQGRGQDDDGHQPGVHDGAGSRQAHLAAGL